jgi:transcriptional regulator with XRE-family HTH domain
VEIRCLTVEISADRLNFLFGSRLSSLRRSRGISQSDLGKKLDLSRTTIANLERGVQNVQLHQVFALAHALDADPATLIPGWSEVVPEEARPESLLEKLRLQFTDLSRGAR